MKMLKQLALMALLVGTQAVFAMDPSEDMSEMASEDVTEHYRDIQRAKGRLVAPTRNLSDTRRTVDASEGRMFVNDLLKAEFNNSGYTAKLKWQDAHNYLRKVAHSPLVKNVSTYRYVLSNHEIQPVMQNMQGAWAIIIQKRTLIPEMTFQQIRDLYHQIQHALGEYTY